MAVFSACLIKSVKSYVKLSNMVGVHEAFVPGLSKTPKKL